MPAAFGGSGEGEPAWVLCDAPTILNALLSFGLAKNARVGKALRHLLALVRENGWPYVVSPSLGNFRGPGRRGDPCPHTAQPRVGCARAS
ncbi:MAG: hypothetical protein NT005_03710 [Spirochaetes bacterium]|nr:hypothetical protein [Spirochaetota bacterium]